MSQTNLNGSIDGYTIQDSCADKALVMRSKRSATSTDSRDAVYIGITSTASARAVSLLAIDILLDRVIIVKDESGAANTNNITITSISGTIDGAATKVINTAYGVVRLICNGTNWFTF